MRRWINPLDGSRLDTGLARGERSVETVGRLADDVGATPPARRRRLAPFPRASARLDAQRTNAAPRTTSTVKAVRLQVRKGRYYVFEDAVERIRRRVVSLFRLIRQVDGSSVWWWCIAARLLTAALERRGKTLATRCSR